MFNQNKRGQNLTLGTILLMLLGVVVVVILLWGATAGFDNLWGTITGYSGTSNVDTIRTSCALACTQKADYSFCSELRELKIANKKATKGSCFDFAMRNSDLGIDNCDICAGSSSNGCNIGDDDDLYCDGVVDSSESEDEEDVLEGGAGGDELLGDEGYEQILEFKGSGDYKVLSLEECKKTLEERKKNLEIPDKLCYWEEMTKLYDEKCDNLDKEEISEIFDEKEKYREDNNKDWAELTYDMEFCIPIIFDCREWILRNEPSRPFGYINPNRATLKEFEEKTGRTPSLKPILRILSVTGNKKGEILLNPFLEVSKDFMKNILIHEGLHSIQSKNRDTLFVGKTLGFPSLSLGDRTAEEFFEKLPEQKKILDKRDNLLEELADLFSCIDKAGTSDALKCYDSRDEILDDYIFELKESFVFVDYKEVIKKENMFYPVTQTKEFKEKEAELRSYMEGEEFKNLQIMYSAYKPYMSSLNELDPRLSEVNRWWLDKTAPDCEIITNSERAEEVLKKFVIEPNIEEGYEVSQAQLQGVMLVAKELGREQEIYDKLANRIPGLAMDDSLIDEGSALV